MLGIVWKALGKFNTGRRQPSEAKAGSLGETTLLMNPLSIKGFSIYHISDPIEFL